MFILLSFREKEFSGKLFYGSLEWRLYYAVKIKNSNNELVLEQI